MIRLALALFLCQMSIAAAETIRVATFNASLSRSAPGLLYRDLTAQPVHPQVRRVVNIIAATEPDILLINEFDYDAGQDALNAFRRLLASSGHIYDHAYAAPSNTGVPSGQDLNSDGELAGPNDAFGFGRFEGEFGMALLSKFPINRERTRTFRTLLWRDFPGARLPVKADGSPFLSREAEAVFRLSSKSHWDVRIELPGGPIHVFASHPTPPVFDGPEDMNGLRNADEIRFWVRYIDGTALPDDQGRTATRSEAPFVVMGDLNSDPVDGDSRHAAIRSLLHHPQVFDPRPESAGAVDASKQSGRANRSHRGDPAQDTADFNDRSPGNLRVDYVIPSSSLTVEGSGVFWPGKGEDGHELLGAGKSAASDHRLVWLDITLP